MTVHQLEAFLVIAGMLALFMSGRLRFDLVAALSLVAAVALGVVPGAKAFSGFSNPVIVIIASVLVVSRAIAASNVLDVWIGALLARVRSPSLQIGILTAAAGYLSAFIRNVVMPDLTVKAFEELAQGEASIAAMGPGGYRFGDYWRLGLPLTIMVLLVGTPLILHAWPLK